MLHTRPYIVVITWLVIIFLSIGVVSPMTAALVTNDYGYAYFTFKENRIIVVMPDGVYERQLPTPPDAFEYPVTIVPSPDGVWLAMGYGGWGFDDSWLRLFNLVSGETQDIPLRKTELRISWSPNSAYITGDGDSDIFIHTLSKNQTEYLTNEVDGFQSDSYWSTDSTRIVALTHIGRKNADSSYTYDYTVNVFDSFTHKQIKLLDFGDETMKLDLFAPVCNQQFSPDNRYLSFTSACDTQPSVPKEVYLWDTQTNTVTRVTHFTTWGAVVIGYYDMLWYDPQTLLISVFAFVNYSEGIKTTTQTLAYNPVTGISTVLNDQVLWDMTLNPITNQLAVSWRSTVNFPDEGVFKAEEVWMTATFKGNGAEMDSDDLVIRSASPGGCHLNWSPDGATLGYTVHPDSSCNANIEKIVFVDAESGALSEHLMPDVPLGTIVGPVGWVIAQS